MLRNVDDHGNHYQALMFVCPGCVAMGGGSGLHLLPVNTEEKNPSWRFNGDLEKPTLSPSILTGKGTINICHSYLVDGMFQFLSDCTHLLRNQYVEIPDLPHWVLDEENDG